MKKILLPIVIMLLIVTLAWLNTFSSVYNEKELLENALESAQENEARGVYKLAIRDYIKVLEIQPDDISHYHKIIELAILAERDEVLEEYAQMTVDRFPKDEKAYYALCELYLQRQDSGRVMDIALLANENLEDVDYFKDKYFEMRYLYKIFYSGYDEVKGFVGDYGPVRLGEKWGLIDSNGKYHIDPNYGAIGVFSSGMAPVVMNSEVYYIDIYGDKILAPLETLDLAYPFIGDYAVISKDSKYGYASKAFDILEMEWDFASSYLNGVAAVEKDGKWALRDENFKFITDFKFDDVIVDENLICSNSSVIFVKENKLYYLVNLKGEKIIESGFEAAKPFTGEGIAPVMKDGKWGFVSAEGEKIIDLKYEEAYAFNYGLAPVKLDNQWSYITQSEKHVIEGDFQEARSFSSDGIAPIKINDRWTYIKLDN